MASHKTHDLLHSLTDSVGRLLGRPQMVCPTIDRCEVETTRGNAIGSTGIAPPLGLQLENAKFRS